MKERVTCKCLLDIPICTFFVLYEVQTGKNAKSIEKELFFCKYQFCGENAKKRDVLANIVTEMMFMTCKYIKTSLYDRKMFILRSES